MKLTKFSKEKLKLYLLSSMISLLAMLLAGCQDNNVIDTKFSNKTNQIKIFWIDDDRFLTLMTVDGDCQDKDGSKNFQTNILEFNTKTKKHIWHGTPDISGLCYADGNIAYYRFSPENGHCSEVIGYFYGPYGEEKEVEKWEKLNSDCSPQSKRGFQGSPTDFQRKLAEDSIEFQRKIIEKIQAQSSKKTISAKTGSFRIAREKSPPKMEKPGLYKEDSSGNLKLILVGDMIDASLSPNGCKLAFGRNTDPDVYKFYLQVIDLCKL